MASLTISSAEIRDLLSAHLGKQQKQETPVADLSIIDFLKTRSTPVFSKGARFFIPVSSKFGYERTGDPLKYSHGERAGQPIDDYVGKFGIKFRNATDGIEQAVPGDGNGVIIIGGAVSPEKALLLQNKLNELTSGTGDPERLNKDAIKALLHFAQTDLKLDDIWSGDKADVLRATPVDGRAVTEHGATKQYSGYFYHQPKAGRDVAAIYVKGGARFKGDVAGGLQDYSGENGFYVTVGIGTDGKPQYRGIREDAFTRDYITGDLAPSTKTRLFSVDAETKEVYPPQDGQFTAQNAKPRQVKRQDSSGYRGGR